MERYQACCDASEGGTRLRLRVTPRAGRTQPAGVHGDALRLRLSAPPVDGKANAALLAWLAEVLGVRASGLVVVAGRRSRDKVVAVPGLAPDEVARRLATRG